jgi:hypothetical protein
VIVGPDGKDVHGAAGVLDATRNGVRNTPRCGRPCVMWRPSKHGFRHLGFCSEHAPGMGPLLTDDEMKAWEVQQS